MRSAVGAGFLLLFCIGNGYGVQPKILESIRKSSSITYRLIHPLHEMKSTSREGVLRIGLDPEKKEIDSISARVDVTSFDSGNSNRDSHAMEAIDAITYPDVTFSSTAVTERGDSLFVAGKLTFHGITKDVRSSGVMKWNTDTLTVNERFGVSLSEFNIERPSLLMIPVQDTLLFSLTAEFALH